ncbi:MAG: bifunctional molybdenum cofactor biosynthesis protein MoaC/MoaB [Acidobacteria bacterium]|nr:MAG: bifunctional molybdenum cofactor biosynthesis protein MoaC/MoaB [Acidobacteriota bacterium]
MLDITRKRVSLRTARAEALVRAEPATLRMIREGTIPKGSVEDVTRAAALLGIKNTPALLPFCHPIPIERGTVRCEIEQRGVRVIVEVAAIARTGVEVEAMTAAAIGALNVYDMIKPVDGTALIESVRLVEKRGGKSDHRETFASPPRAGVLVASDSVAAGRAEDGTGPALREALAAHGVEVAALEVVPDEIETIRERVRRWVDDERLDLVFVAGGTGLGPRDVTPEALEPLIERPLPGVAEALRAHGRERTPHANLGRNVAGARGGAVIVATGGSPRAATEALDALMPWLLHALEVREEGFRHGD